MDGLVLKPIFWGVNPTHIRSSDRRHHCTHNGGFHPSINHETSGWSNPSWVAARGLWPALSVASIQNPTSALRPPDHARMRKNVRDPARARGAQLHHHTTASSCATMQNMMCSRCTLHLILRCFCATILTPYHPQPLGPLTPQIHRAARHNSSPYIAPVRSGTWQHKLQLFSQLAAHAHRRSRTTRIEMNAFGSPTRMLVRHLHHTGEQRQVNDLQKPARKIEPHGVHRILR